MRLIQSIPTLLELDHRARVLFQRTACFVACLDAVAKRIARLTFEAFARLQIFL